MMIGSYPCCDGDLWLPMPDRTPAYSREECPHCGAIVWHRFSRIDPTSWTEADFLAEHEVDEATKTINTRTVRPLLAAGGAMTPAVNEFRQRMLAAFRELVLNGSVTLPAAVSDEGVAKP